MVDIYLSEVSEIKLVATNLTHRFKVFKTWSFHEMKLEIDPTTCSTVSFDALFFDGSTLKNVENVRVYFKVSLNNFYF